MNRVSQWTKPPGYRWKGLLQARVRKRALPTVGRAHNSSHLARRVGTLGGVGLPVAWSGLARPRNAATPGAATHGGGNRRMESGIKLKKLGHRARLASSGESLRACTGFSNRGFETFRAESGRATVSTDEKSVFFGSQLIGFQRRKMHGRFWVIKILAAKTARCYPASAIAVTFS